MKTLRRFQCSFILLMTLASVNTAVALDPKQAMDDAGLNAIATNAFRILRDVPFAGLEKSLPGLNQLIETHQRLLKTKDTSQIQLSLTLADGVAYAIFTEIRRADVARLGSETNMTPKSIPFDKKIAVRLWEVNMPDFPAAIRHALKGKGIVTGYIAAHLSEANVLNGDWIWKAPSETIGSRYWELEEQALNPLANCKKPSEDEQLIYALCKYQAFRDLSIIIKLYEKNDLPYDDSKALRAMIDEQLKKSPQTGKRLDDGMEIIAFKVWSTSNHYFPGARIEGSAGTINDYYVTQAVPLIPFMTDRSLLPEFLTKVLNQRDRRAAANKSKADKAD